MKKPKYITCLEPVIYDQDNSCAPPDFDVAVWIDKDYWLEEFDGKPNHVVIPSINDYDWGFEKQDNTTYWTPFQDVGDCIDWYRIDDTVLINTLGKNHPFIQTEASCIECKGELLYLVSTLDLELSDLITNDDIWNILHATMRAKTYRYMRCLTITSPYYHPDYFEGKVDPYYALLPVEQYAIALGLDPNRTHADHCWRGG